MCCRSGFSPGIFYIPLDSLGKSFNTSSLQRLSLKTYLCRRVFVLFCGLCQSQLCFAFLWNRCGAEWSVCHRVQHFDVLHGGRWRVQHCSAISGELIISLSVIFDWGILNDLHTYVLHCLLFARRLIVIHVRYYYY